MLRKKFEYFSNFIFTHPAIICSFLFIFAFILPIILLFVFPLRLGNNPEKGFETDGTEYSKTRLTWARLQPYLLQGSQVEFNLENEQNLQKRINKRSWANDLINSMFSAVTCYDEPIPAMSFLSQFVIEIADKDSLFSLEFIQQLCSLQQKLFFELSSFSSFTLYKNIWSWSNFVNCLAPNQRDNCSQINEEDVNSFKNIFFHHCLPHRQTILDCGRICGQIKSSISGNILNTSQRQKREFTSSNNLFEEFIEEKNKCFQLEICLKIPKECKGQMWFDLFYRILPEDVYSRPLFLNNFLPFYTFAAYRLQGISVPLNLFVNFEFKLKEIAKEKDTLFELKGLSLDTKRDLLLEAALNDSKLTLISASIVFALLAIYSLSIVFALIVSLQLASSVFISLAIFRLFISSEIPELNLISFVLLISVGSDGAFLLLDVFPAPERLTPTTLNKALKHIAKTMFLTQFSTVIPFMLNLLSSVYAFRQQHQNTRCSPLLFKFPTNWLERYRHFNRLVLDDILPSVLIQGRFVWLGSLFIFFGINIYLICTQLSLPRYNPLQLFRASNTHEFYDQNAEQLYPFIADKIGELPFSIRLVWGIQLINNNDTSLSNYFDPNSENQQKELLKIDLKNFKMDTPAQLQALAHQISRLQKLNFSNLPVGDKFWPERFIEWTSSTACNSTSISTSSHCCKLFGNRIAPVSPSIFDHCIRLSTTILPTGYNDTLIWDRQTHKLVGYTALLPNKLIYSHRFANLSASFELIDQTIRPIIDGNEGSLKGWYTTEWGVISQWFDLQRSIIEDCKQSFIVSLLVVLLFSAVMLRLNSIYATLTIVSIVCCTLGMLLLLGWEIGVLEAVILVVVVGLSFDYTLHFGATMPSKVCPKHALQMAIRGAIRPILMSTVSSILAGAVMLFAETHAFFQVGIFLVVCSSLSLLFAIFFFLPLFYVITTWISKLYKYFLSITNNENSTIKIHKIQNCEWCFISQQAKNDLKMKKFNKNENRNNISISKNNRRLRGGIIVETNERGMKIAGIRPKHRKPFIF
uniref:Uncharacterized protein n=1 Tax=Meloidogyne enterolobii TaxID=390850 RepID=A0A6V7Y0N9_MELEN|nr:unnamed protein product [Meloidogyne enterolobii]